MRTPVQNSVALRASGVPIGSPSSVGTQLGATKLNSRPSKTSKPQPSHAAKTTVHWYPVRSQTRRPPPACDMGVDSTRWAARTGWALLVLACLFTFIGSSAHAQETDLDALMARCLERRNETWRVLHDYVLDERERFALEGPSDVRLFGSDRQYTWYVQDGILVRSPVRFNGVAVPDADRREYEAQWLNEERSRAERAQKKKDEKKAEKDDEKDDETRTQGDRGAGPAGREPGRRRAGAAAGCRGGRRRRRDRRQGPRAALRLRGQLPALPVRARALLPGRA